MIDKVDEAFVKCEEEASSRRTEVRRLVFRSSLKTDELISRLKKR